MSNVDKATVIREIQRLAEQNGGVPVGQNRFVDETGLPKYLFRGGLWANWSDAVVEAGYAPRQLQQQIHDDDDLLRHLAELTRDVGRLPMLSAPISLTGVDALKYSTNPGVSWTNSL